MILVSTSTSGADTPTSLTDNLGNTYRIINGSDEADGYDDLITGGGSTELVVYYCIVQYGGTCTVSVTWKMAMMLG